MLVVQLKLIKLIILCTKIKKMYRDAKKEIQII